MKQVSIERGVVQLELGRGDGQFCLRTDVPFLNFEIEIALVGRGELAFIHPSFAGHLAEGEPGHGRSVLAENSGDAFLLQRLVGGIHNACVDFYRFADRVGAAFGADLRQRGLAKQMRHAEVFDGLIPEAVIKLVAPFESPAPGGIHAHVKNRALAVTLRGNQRVRAIVVAFGSMLREHKRCRTAFADLREPEHTGKSCPEGLILKRVEMQRHHRMHFAVIGQIHQERLGERLENLCVLTTRLVRLNLDREEILKWCVAVGERIVWLAGYQNEPGAFLAHKTLDELHLLFRKIVGIHVSQDHQVVDRKQVLLFLWEFLHEPAVLELCERFVTAAQQNLQVHAVVAQNRVLEVAVFPARITLDEQDFNTVINHTDSAGATVIFGEQFAGIHRDLSDELKTAGLFAGELETDFLRAVPGRKIHPSEFLAFRSSENDRDLTACEAVAAEAHVHRNLVLRKDNVIDKDVCDLDVACLFEPDADRVNRDAKILELRGRGNGVVSVIVAAVAEEYDPGDRLALVCLIYFRQGAAKLRCSAAEREPLQPGFVVGLFTFGEHQGLGAVRKLGHLQAKAFTKLRQQIRVLGLHAVLAGTQALVRADLVALFFTEIGRLLSVECPGKSVQLFVRLAAVFDFHAVRSIEQHHQRILQSAVPYELNGRLKKERQGNDCHE